MKFKFSLEKLLVQRNIQVNMDRKNYLERKNAYDAELQKLEKMIEDKKQVFIDRNTKIAESSNWQNDVESMNTFLSGQDLRIAQQNKRLKELEKEVEFLRQILLKSVTEAKIIERLKEKKKEEFKNKFFAGEQKELDEIVSMTFKNKPSLGLKE